ncbi:HET-domain-containing protein [Trematosphaeria pertusa]|uniref:HET-domain-containing protein n=1 Tax=Trematosphaeria pertusa TaxID=390896 RepID=A0A6A6ISS3_9PLEO|nr:HET-domain-containing protein [Trematosphaeria pertusa]KAF2252882.1 HET-domain-containing protein [Trematosphaeria pertusa]
MRLLHSQTLQFKVFNGERLPSFLILSHTWGDEEVNYQDMVFVQQEDIIGSAGFRKIQKTAEVAREHHYEYFWVDTCCIDKTNSAELQEAINSMFLWYQKSAVCVVYLEDVAAGLNWMDNDLGELLPKSRWTTRGWTLQELIAPRNVHFYDQSWVYITQKHAAPFDVHRATKIPEYVLLTGDLSRASVAQKMSWAAYRSTVRIEDRAYSLMGLFGVHVPMLYGEGENAFIRLQEEILRTTADDSIFAWHAEERAYVLLSLPP